MPDPSREMDELWDGVMPGRDQTRDRETGPIVSLSQPRQTMSPTQETLHAALALTRDPGPDVVRKR